MGGGTSGWMTALAISKSLPDVELTVIHNDNPIGVGEATFENIKHFHSFLGIEEKEFMKASDATFKFGIWFDDFLEKGESYCHLFKYGISDNPFQYQRHYKNIELWRSYLQNTEPLKGIEWSKFMNPYTHFLLKNKIPFGSQLLRQDPQYVEENELMPRPGGHGYHMDAVKYQEFLKSKIKCTIIKSTVENVKIGNDGIEWIIVADDPENKIKADLFIDCSGFNQVLIKSFGNTWWDFGEYLPNNRAVVCRTPYTDPENEMCPFVRCTGMDSGWKWTIPLYSRLSHGYVYSDDYITPAQAEVELRNYLDRGSKDEVHHVQFKSGVLQKSWVKNCVALGLSSCFVEPLESTGIAIFVRQIIDLLKVLEKGFVKRLDKDEWNITNVNDSKTIKNFIAHHFLHTLREDTEYWKDWKYNRTTDRESLPAYKWLKQGCADSHEIAYLSGFNQSSTFFPPASFDQLLSSMGATDHQSKIALRYQNLFEFADQIYETRHAGQSNNKKDFDNFLEIKALVDNQISEKVKLSPNHYDYLKKRIYE